ncbi:glucose-methanol-choline oxidoreductase [Lampropedia cohaerens]|uniref:Glucose-methanol-choline oxidoreductase n=1 Tax=Lampropedia cohaerens TaxID=1610491 RepID=A0A0U1Q404_9BURK|nr:GMC family oxidoreductase N-terminal domain-containing protein [Lampropedia cohaerens]KKW69365.1 glucose-methanol-choline oxidoreductase [Lampropedia cohaerens]
MQQEFDYIVVGAGSAGCVVATRLIEAKAGTVLLLEAGGVDKSLFHKIPATVVKVFQQKSWPYMTEPQRHCGNRSMLIAQGKVLGGGSSVNGMIYIRGQRDDYEDWVRDWGAAGWGYEDVLPYFKKAERNESLGPQFHGQAGPWPISENRFRHPLTEAFIRAGQEMGLPYVNDFNGANQEGVGFYQTNTLRGERMSTARAYLQRVRTDPALTVVTDALTHRVTLEDGWARGVEFSVKGDAVQRIRARKEVIVSAGTFGTAKILQLSGIGPGAHLQDIGLETKVDLPVGLNFHDHLHMSLNATIHAPISFFGEDRPLRALRHMLQWLWFRTGMLTSNVLEGGAFIDSQGVGRPDIQFHFLPLLDNFDNTPGEKPKASGHGLSVKVGHLRSKSRGQVMLRSADPSELVKIDANFLSHPEDLDNQIRAVQTGLKILAQPALQNLITKVTEPDGLAADDRVGLEAFVRKNIKTTYHPGGTACLGSVTDMDLRVKGVRGLRVVDMSICPQVPSGNTNAVAVMIGERGADFILGRKTA